MTEPGGADRARRSGPGARCRRFASSSPEAREGRPRGSQGDDVVHQDSATTRTQGEFAWQLGADPGSIRDARQAFIPWLQEAPTAEAHLQELPVVAGERAWHARH